MGFWVRAIEKEFRNVQLAFNILEKDESVPVGFQHIDCHWIFDIKMNFTRKAKFVVGGHMTEPPSSLTYLSVVSRETIRIALTIAALNDLDIMAAGIGNAYLNEPYREKVYFTIGTEFGAKKGQYVVVIWSLYELKTSGSAWRSFLIQSMYGLGFKSCKADPDLWMTSGTKNDGTKYWDYVLIYVDNILWVSHAPGVVM
eukprot:1789369-Ditylum_brightwellii.AAC.1